MSPDSLAMRSSGKPTDLSEEPSTIGDRLRARRTALRLTLADVACAAGISEGFLSQVERSRTNASISTLQRLSVALRLPVGDLFAEPRTSRVHRRDSTEFQDYGAGARKVLLTPTSNSQLQSFYGEFDPNGETGPDVMAHGDNEEFLLVIEGCLEVTVGDERHILNSGDGISYRSSTPHRSREVQGQPARCVWMMSPGSF